MPLWNAGRSGKGVDATPQLTHSAPSLKRFGVFELDPVAGELRKQGRKLKLEGQPLQVLHILLEQPGRMVSREELREKLWPADTFVDFEQGINSAIKRLRQTLDDSAETPRYIETLPRRGYRFIYAVADPESAPLPAKEEHRRLALAAALTLVTIVVAVVALAWPALRQRLFAHTAPTVRSVVVLPLENLTGDSGNEYLARGFADDLTHEILRVDTWNVTPFETGLKHRNSGKTPAEVARDIGVQACIAGTLQQDGDRFRINIKLVYADDDRQLAWSYWPMRDEMASLPRRAAVDILQEAVGAPAATQARFERKRNVKAAAYAAYAMGRNAYWTRVSEEGHRASIESFQQAIALEPTYAEAYAAMARSYVFLHQLHPSEGFNHKARAAAEKALQIDSELAEPHAVLANLKRQEDDRTGADEEYRLAIRLNPRDAVSHFSYSVFLADSSRKQEALQEALRAEELDQQSAFTSAAVVLRYMELGRCEDAIRQGKKAQQLDPTLWTTHSFAAGALWKCGRREEGIAEWETALSLPGVYERWVLAQLVVHYAQLGRSDDAQNAFERLRQLPDVEAGRLAAAYAAVGNKKKALEILKAPKARVNYGDEELYVFLRDEPEFQRLRELAAGKKAGNSPIPRK